MEKSRKKRTEWTAFQKINTIATAIVFVFASIGSNFFIAVAITVGILFILFSMDQIESNILKSIHETSAGSTNDTESS